MLTLLLKYSVLLKIVWYTIQALIAINERVHKPGTGFGAVKIQKNPEI